MPIESIERDRRRSTVRTAGRWTSIVSSTTDRSAPTVAASAGPTLPPQVISGAVCPDHRVAHSRRVPSQRNRKLTGWRRSAVVGHNIRREQDAASGRVICCRARAAARQDRGEHHRGDRGDPNGAIVERPAARPTTHHRFRLLRCCCPTGCRHQVALAAPLRLHDVISSGSDVPNATRVKPRPGR